MTSLQRIALIPARGGSKRIPGKNWRGFCGKPMIVWSIEAARAANLFDRVIVSTDDAKIASIARDNGADVPFERPTDLADDFTPTRDVINHAIAWLEDNETDIEQLCCIYATAPFVRPEALIDAQRILEDDPALDFVFAATTFPFPVQRALLRRETGGVEMLFPDHAQTRSQDLPEAFHDAGQFYWGRRDAFVAGRPMFSEKSAPYLLDRLSVQDIDTSEDWGVAEALFRLRDKA